MITIIAEKPSVAMEIARIVGARTRKDGYMEGGGYAVTWALGHLVEICAEGDEDWSAQLPFLPEHFDLRVARTRRKDGKAAPDPGYAKQLGIIRNLFGSSEYIINAGDAGREGELIQRYIYSYVGGHVPVKRLWISSLTDEAIREGLRSLRPSSEFDSIYAAGRARSEADWLVGVNATRALTKASGGTVLRSLGRVQTPTLALVCRRFLENRDFVPSPFWTLQVKAHLGEDGFSAASGRYEDLSAAYADREKVVSGGTLRVTSVEKKTVSVKPPLLYDLTALQREANKRYSMTAQETLSTAQSLYEKKLITYPRTGSRYLTEDVFHTLPGVLKKLAPVKPNLPILNLAESRLNRHSVNESKVTDHHALIPTGVRPEGLSGNELKIYELILIRLLEAVSPACEMMETAVLLEGSGVPFSLKGRAILTPGWKSIRGEKEPQTDEQGNEILDNIPPFHEGDACPLDGIEIKEGKTKPKPLYTEASLLEAMEHAGREVSDESLQDALKECGLGTPATRAGEIETIIRRGYVERNAKTLVPTRVGLSVYEIVKDRSIADVALTASWERTLAEIAEGRYNVENFDKGIRLLVAEMVEELLSNSDTGQALSSSEAVPGAKCPLCGRAVLMTSKLVRCQDESSCGWKIWRDIAGKTLSEREILSLLGSGKTM
ncbi:MAG: DNA topoisomerase III, partial [Clostridia bacterium]|nr:DNA topoisomerase III [Clostridia bacterium]